MTSSQTERDVVLALRDVLRPRYDWITAHRKPSASSSVRRELHSKLGHVPILQPEIDLAFGKEDRAYGVEVKVFNASQASFRLPFYEGMGQALAMHRYGFDAAALWFVFAGGLTPSVRQYGAQAWYFLRNELNAPLDFTFFTLEDANGQQRFRVIQYLSRTDCRPHRYLDDPLFRITFKHPNPLLAHSYAHRIRDTLLPWLQRGN